ncbi:hypothetical protein MMPV_007421 [Pyropia vietnamensis]
MSQVCSDEEVLVGLGGTSSGVSVRAVRMALSAAGIRDDDQRVASSLQRLQEAAEALPEPPAGGSRDDAEVPAKAFFQAVTDATSLLHKVATGELVVANFPQFVEHLDRIYEEVAADTSGAVADYIPTLRDAEPDRYGVAFTSVDGQVYERGDDTRFPFSIQSTSKAVMFAAALEEAGVDETLKWVGVEPSGRVFNDLALLPDGRPYNAMVNSGAMMTTAVVAAAHPKLAAADEPDEDGAYGDRLCKEVLMPLWTRLSGGGHLGKVGFDRETFLAERATADTNYAIAYSMRGRTGLPGDLRIDTMTDLYFRSCSISANCAMMSVVAATLANGGKCPTTDDRVFSVEVTKKLLSSLSFCGMYDSAGEFFFRTGLPAKSGVSGIVFIVVPNVGGLAIFSPRLDAAGNSVRGTLFARELVARFTFHSFDNLSSLSTGCKLDPRFSLDAAADRHVARLRWAVRAGDQQAVSFARLLLTVAVRAAAIDGDWAVEEAHTVADVYESILCTRLSPEEVEAERKRVEAEGVGAASAAEACGGGDRAAAAIAALAERVREADVTDDMCRELLLEAAFKVAVADGKRHATEDALLRALAVALAVEPAVLEMRLAEFAKLPPVERKVAGEGDPGKTTDRADGGNMELGRHRSRR